MHFLHLPAVFIIAMVGVLGGSLRAASAASVTFTPAQIWPDSAGEHINAHCGDIIKVGDRWYWFGEYRVARRVQSIACYVSTDLLHWQQDALVLTPSAAANAAINDSHLERPKVIFNPRTKKFVMWMHRENTTNYNEAQCAVATCDTVDGDYAWQGAFNPNGNMSRDCTLFQDDDDAASAYFISSSRNNADMVLYKLSDDYLKVAEQVAVLTPGLYREAPCLFKRNGVYYLITSFCTGIWPNTQYYSSAKSLAGPWSPPRRLAGEDTWNTYYTQGAFVLPVKGTQTTTYLYCADRWQVQPMRHVWLPMQFNDDGSIALLRWADSWSLDLDTGIATMPEATKPIANDLARGAIATSDYKDSTNLGRNPNGDRSYSHLAGHEPAAAVDGDPATSWVANDNLSGHWLKVDLEQPQGIASVAVIWYRNTSDYAYHIDVSPDDRQWETKIEHKRGSPRATTGSVRRNVTTHEIQAENARHVRITIDVIPSGYDWPGIAGFSVFDSAHKDLAAGKAASADSFQPNTTDPAAAIDGNYSTAWTIDDNTTNHWLKLDLGKPTDINGCRILWEAPGFWYQYKVETSTDDSAWTQVVDQSSNQAVVRQPTHQFDAKGVRYVRLTLINCERGCWPGVRAFELIP